MHFSGRNSNRFYRIARLCEIFHSPVNFAMLFLADETYLNRHKDFVLKVGKPIPLANVRQVENRFGMGIIC